MKTKIVTKLSNSQEALVASKYFLAALFLLTFFGIFLPYPNMPSIGLDPSWQYVMNEAIAQKFAIGKDIIFTAGPYSFLYTHLFHPATANLELFSGLYLALCYWLMVLMLMQSVALRFRFACWFIVVVSANFLDAIFLCYPVLTSLVVFRVVFAQKNQIDTIKISERPLVILLFLIFSPLGLLPLIKGSCSALALFSVLVSSVMLFHRKRYGLMAAIMLSPALSICCFWTASGQELANLPSYFVNMGQIISGYTEAMSFRGKWLNIIAFLVSVLVILFFSMRKKQVPLFPKLVLFLILSSFFFIAFKAGFVRHNGVFNTQLIMAAMLPFFLRFKTKEIVVMQLVALVSWSVAVKNYEKFLPQNLFSKVISQAYAHHGLEARIFNQDDLINDFQKTVSRIKNDAEFPLLDGKTDIYNFDQSHLIASGNKWAPRPIFQSYSSYTPKLSQINADYFDGKNAPENIFFKVQSIDDRFLSLDDGLSWPIFLWKYAPTKMVNDFVLLQRVSDEKAPIRKKIFSGVGGLGEEVIMPNSNQMLFAEIKIKQTLIGRLISFLFKPSQLQISVILERGDTKTYRIPSKMAESGFIISPVMESSEDFVAAYDDPKFLRQNRVKSFVISSRKRGGFFWEKNYDITLSEVEVRRANNLKELVRFDKFGGVASRKIDISNSCTGSIDYLNGLALLRANELKDKIKLSGTMKISGWLAVINGDKMIVPEEVVLIFIDPKGQKKYLKTKLNKRPDLRAHFAQDRMENAGYKAYFDLSELSGEYSLSISYSDRDKIKSCANLTLPLLIN